MAWSRAPRRGAGPTRPRRDVAADGPVRPGGRTGPSPTSWSCSPRPTAARPSSPWRPSDGARPAPSRPWTAPGVSGWLALDDRPALWLGDDRAADAVLDRAVAAVCAEMLGAADVVLAMTVQYAKDRVQFGRPIGSFQAVKHRCADMLVDVEGMRSAAYYAAWAVGAGDPEASAAASAAKIWCSDAARASWRRDSRSMAASGSRGSTTSTSS